MKALLLATALIAVPVLAQSDTSITTQSTTTNSADKPLQDPSTPTAKDANQPNDTSITTRSSTTPAPNMPDQAGQVPPAPSAPMDPAAAPPSSPADPAAMAPSSPPPAAGGQVVFRQPPTVEQAFPPPTAKESYPWCSRTVTDGCKQRFDPK